MTFSFRQTERNDFVDEQAVRERHWHPERGQVVLDVGAGVGSYALPALAEGAEVVALSPDPANTRELRGNLALNAGFPERCRVLLFGAYDRPGWMLLNADRTRYIFTDVKPTQDVEAFPVQTLDSLDLKQVDWVKVDVEGAELDVLRGAEGIIRRCRPRLLVECHLFMDGTLLQRVTDWVLGLELGYAVESHQWHSVAHAFFEARL